MSNTVRIKEDKIPSDLPKYLMNIWKILIWRGIPQKSLMKPLGKSQPEVNRLLRYKKQMKVDELLSIADFFKIHADVLYFDLPTKEYFLEISDVIKWYYTLKQEERGSVLKFGLMHFKVLQEEIKSMPFLVPRRFLSGKK